MKSKSINKNDSFCRYFTRRSEINSLADDSFRNISSYSSKCKLRQQIILEQDIECLQFPYPTDSNNKESPTEKDNHTVPSCPLLDKGTSEDNTKTWLWSVLGILWIETMESETTVVWEIEKWFVPSNFRQILWIVNTTMKIRIRARE